MKPQTSVRTVLLWVLFALCATLFFACANVGTITGGAKDTTPPKILSQNPENNTVYFSQKEIKLLFDEYIELVNVDQNMTLSPPTQTPPTYSIKGKAVIVDLKNCLLDSNTSYLLYNNGAIKDFTEGNLMDNFSICFSTGSYIDSMHIAGKLVDAFTKENVQEALVLLHTDTDDSTLCKQAPVYLTHCDKKGHFLFTNLPNKEYKISALIDKNQNKLFDQSDETVGFLSQSVQTTIMPPSDSSNTRIFNYDSLCLFLFVEEDTTIKYNKRELFANYIHRLIFKGKIEHLDLIQASSLDTSIRLKSYVVPTKDTAYIYFIDTINVPFDFAIVANGQILDTVSITPGQKSRIRQRNTEENQKVFLPFSTKEGTLFSRANITFLYPIQEAKENAFVLITSKDTLNDTTAINYYFVDSLHRTIELDYDFTQENFNYLIMGRDSSFFNYFGICNDTIRLNVSTNFWKDYGNLKFHYQFYQDGNYIVELLDEKGNVVQSDQVKTNQTIDYQHLSPGKYRSRIIVDSNNNGKWDSGKYVLRQQPETIIYCPKTIDVIANWKIEETFEVSEIFDAEEKE